MKWRQWRHRNGVSGSSSGNNGIEMAARMAKWRWRK
jgi:hypothetical protein